MHLLTATHDLYPDPGSGGTGRYVYETARRLVDRGHRVSVLTRRRGDVPERERIDGVDVRRYDVDVAGESAPSIAAQLPRARRTVAGFLEELGATGRGDADVDLLSFQGPLTSLLAHRAAAPDLPRVYTFHSPWSTEYRIRARHEANHGTARRRINALLRRRVESRVLAASDGVVTLSEYMADRLAAVHGDGIDPSVVPGGVDVDRYAPDAGSFRPVSDDEGVSFLTVRRLSPRMGHATLLEAFASVAERHPDARLYVAGDGPLRDELRRRAGRLGVADRTTFLGYVPDADLPAAHASADVFVLPTRRLEGFGLATLEALASGTPVVATPVGGTPEVLRSYVEGDDRPAATLADGADAGSLARAMNAWADLPPERRRNAGRACREHTVDRFRWERTVDELEAVYAAHVEGEAPARPAPPRR
ncbi:glycosyltransferase family 4 protein [Halorarum salinum]|uniref:Glycosyltransferase family 4 protein n=1 Tax=Halorarum salinum TaxID=2743089 RepID=A0A7D5L8E3_9EURY|nr:glycosyltransferase family 4 protein [Halobaculum salinum]QLG60431.1 glycosyltransferase family 4 protein [Halobaculum salinum]